MTPKVLHPEHPDVEGRAPEVRDLLTNPRFAKLGRLLVAAARERVPRQVAAASLRRRAEELAQECDAAEDGFPPFMVKRLRQNVAP